MKYSESMSNRIRQMAELIPQNTKSIMDIGCGVQTLKKYLSSNIDYYGIDLYKHKPTTIIKDINKGEFLEKKVDVIFVSGVFEYIYNIDSLLKKIYKYSDILIGSYIFKEDHPDRLKIWVNGYTQEEFVNKLKQQGYNTVTVKITEDNENSIFIAEK